MRGRALKRHHARRNKKKVRYYYMYWYDLDDVPTPRQNGINARTKHPCSGACCGNPRRHFGELTMQERRANQEVYNGAGKEC